MIELLRIQNLALISDLELEFSPGLNVLSGETGAGKSFILRAVNFLTGDRLPPDFVRPGADKASVEALFVLGGEDTVIRRELSADTGRSRLYVNDRLSSLDTVGALKSKLFLHTSQHGQQRLLSPAYQARVLDKFLPETEILVERARLLGELGKLGEELEELDARVRALAERRDFLEFQKGEIAKVDPRPGEEDELIERKQAAGRLRKTAEAVEEALGLLLGQEFSVRDAVARLAARVSELAELNPGLAEEAEFFEEAKHRLGELTVSLRRLPVMEAEADLEAIEARLFALSNLKRKLGKDLQGILSLKSEISENLSFLDSAELDRKNLKKKESALAGELAGVIERLNASRRTAARDFSDKLASELSTLGFSEHLRVEVAFEPVEVYANLLEDRPRILWVPNPGQPPQPLDKIASGGELSRFLLALTGLLAREELPTLIFDEVDSGIGGLTLGRVAERIQDLSRRQQVVLITHWPQLAARADRHFHVVKEVIDGQTHTQCLPLTGSRIFDELTRMGGGGEQGRALARELLAQ